MKYMVNVLGLYVFINIIIIYIYKYNVLCFYILKSVCIFLFEKGCIKK